MTPVESFLRGERASSLALISASACKPERGLQSRREWAESQFSCDQFLVGNATSDSGRDQAIQTVKRFASHVSLIEPKSEFIHVPLCVLLAELVKSSVEPALENRPNALNAVRVRHAVDELLGAVIYGQMVIGGDVQRQSDGGKALVRSVFVRADGRTSLNADENVIYYFVSRSAIQHHGMHSAVALTHSEYTSLADCAPAHVQLLVFVLVRFLASKVGFINLNNATQNRWIITASLTETLQNEPCRLLCNTDLFRELEAADAFSACNEQVHGIEPFVQRNVAALKDCASAYGEVLFALIASVVIALAQRDALAQAANRAAATVRPESRFKINTSRLSIWKKFKQLKSANCGVHYSSPEKYRQLRASSASVFGRQHHAHATRSMLARFPARLLEFHPIRHQDEEGSAPQVRWGHAWPHGLAQSSGLSNRDLGDCSFFDFDDFGIQTFGTNSVFDGGAGHGIGRSDFDCGWITFSELKFSISRPRLKHFAGEVFATFFVVDCEKFLDFVQADFVYGVVCNFHFNSPAPDPEARYERFVHGSHYTDSIKGVKYYLYCLINLKHIVTNLYKNSLILIRGSYVYKSPILHPQGSLCAHL